MTDPITQDIATKDMHATSEPALDAITAKITGTEEHAIATKDMHATSEPALAAIAEKVTGQDGEKHDVKPVD
ncbi:MULTISPECIES: hypothetical protein [unclassified Streptomyces]|uniref:hypothetical protein n=1 Tax=unclassified Streptomyces TaxID=2593676 RepID=UPI00166025E5|nr:MULTISPECIES: hypothetical protein [unclassified Streptomyces]MBD0709377.1 hypothetical protein [Streptomyces sp. CBMA291]MBD0713860.1 hypothetical protein [Streptomyces sp. CBMA370]